MATNLNDVNFLNSNEIANAIKMTHNFNTAEFTGIRRELTEIKQKINNDLGNFYCIMP